MRILCNLSVFFHGVLRDSLRQSTPSVAARQLPQGGAFRCCRKVCDQTIKLMGALKPSPGRGKVDANAVSRRMRAQASSSLRQITPHPALRATFPPRGEGFSGSGKLCGLAGNCAAMPKAPSQRGLARRSRDWGSSSPYKQNHRSIRRRSGGFTITI